MGKVYVAPIDIADAGTDADQDIVVLLAGATEKAELITVEVTSDVETPTAVKLEVVERSGIGTGGTAIVEEDIDRAQDSTSTATVTTDAETPGTGTAVFETHYWEQMGAWVHRPVPEERYVMDVATVWALNLLTNPVNAAFGGKIVWKEP